MVVMTNLINGTFPTDILVDFERDATKRHPNKLCSCKR